MNTFLLVAFSDPQLFLILVGRIVTMRALQNSASRPGWLTSIGLPVSALVLSILALCAPSSCWALGPRGGGFHFPGGQHGGGQHAVQPAHPAPAPQARPSQSAPSRPQAESRPSAPANSRPSYPSVQAARPNAQQARPGQQHLPDWFNSRQNMTPQQRENSLRNEPGFRNLPSDQQQRLVNRLHSLDQKTPEERQRTLARNENFEHLTPERQQEVRGASQALAQMPPDRQQAVRRAFQQLRQMPPQQRQQMLSSGGYAAQFSPQERTVLGNLLSIEPYQGHPGAIPQPYFGR
jgi:hypothetical protein